MQVNHLIEYNGKKLIINDPLENINWNLDLMYKYVKLIIN